MKSAVVHHYGEIAAWPREGNTGPVKKEEYDYFDEEEAEEKRRAHRAARLKKERAKKRTVTLFVIIAAAVLAAVLIAILAVTLKKSSTSGSIKTAQATAVSTSISYQEISVPAAATATPAPEPTIEPTPESTNTPAPSLAPDSAEYLFKTLTGEADTSLCEGIVNILFIGVDYEESRTEKSWSGKNGNSFHADVMMVCAVNFDENRVDLISLPRDTYAEIPGVEGIYKLNASLNCGTDGKNYGIFCKNGEGFEKVCEAAEWMLGGIKVDYYYAVTMESIKNIIDVLGGVDYDLEGNFDNGGRYYKKGFQHMDGQACLDYMRVRKGGHGQLSTTDANRVNRQKSMMVALFKSVKASNLILKLPALIETFGEGLYTNCTAAQTAVFALFAYGLDPADIGMYSMSGSTVCLFHWNFLFTDQANRVDIIQKVYNVKVKKQNQYTLAYAKYRWGSLLMPRYTELCEGLDAYVSDLLGEDDLLPVAEQTEEPWEEPEPEEEPTPKPTAKPTAEPEPEPEEEPTAKPTAEPEPEPEPEPEEDPAPEEDEQPTGLEGIFTPVTYSGIIREAKANSTRRYTQEQRDLFARFEESYEEMTSLYATCKKEAKKSGSNSLGTYSSRFLTAMAETQELAIQVAKSFKYTEVENFTKANPPTSTYTSGSPWGYAYWKERSFNEIQVNFN